MSIKGYTRGDLKELVRLGKLDGKFRSMVSISPRIFVSEDNFYTPPVLPCVHFDSTEEQELVRLAPDGPNDKTLTYISIGFPSMCRIFFSPDKAGDKVQVRDYRLVMLRINEVEKGTMVLTIMLMTEDTLLAAIRNEKLPLPPVILWYVVRDRGDKGPTPTQYFVDSFFYSLVGKGDHTVANGEKIKLDTANAFLNDAVYIYKLENDTHMFLLKPSTDLYYDFSIDSALYAKIKAMYS